MNQKPGASIREWVLEQVLMVCAVWSLFRRVYVLTLLFAGLLFLWPAVRDWKCIREAYSQNDLDREPQLRRWVKRNTIIVGIKFWLGVALLSGAACLAFGWPTKLNSLSSLLPHLAGAVLAGLGIVTFRVVDWSTSGRPRDTLWGSTVTLMVKACGVLLVLGGAVLVVASVPR